METKEKAWDNPIPSGNELDVHDEALGHRKPVGPDPEERTQDKAAQEKGGGGTGSTGVGRVA